MWLQIRYSQAKRDAFLEGFCTQLLIRKVVSYTDVLWY